MLEAILRKIKGKEKISSGNYDQLVTAIQEGDVQTGDLIEVDGRVNLLFEYLPKPRKAKWFYPLSPRMTFDGEFHDWSYESGEWVGRMRGIKVTEVKAERNLNQPTLFAFLRGRNYTGFTVGNERAGYTRNFGERFADLPQIETWRNLGPVTSEQNREKWEKQLEVAYKEVTKAQTH